jgi:hypothetical protein
MIMANQRSPNLGDPQVNASEYFYEMIIYQVLRVNNGQIEVIRIITQEQPTFIGWVVRGAALSAIITPPTNTKLLIRKQQKLTSQITKKDSI